MTDGVLQQVEEHALELFGIGSRPRRAVGKLGRYPHDGSVGVCAHRLDGLIDDLGDRHPLEAPADVARLEAGELEEVVDERPEGVHVRAHAPQVVGTLLAVDQLVANRFSQKAQAGDRGAQVVGYGRDQIAARAPFGLDALERGALDHPAGPEPECGGERRRDHGEERIGSLHEHRRSHQRDDHRELRDDQHRHRGELAP